MTRARDLADLGQDKATLASYVDTGVTDTEFDYLDGVTSSIQTQLGTKSPLASPTFTGSITTPEIRSGATLTIDPATVGDNTGLVLLKGNLQVDGTSTTINSTTLTVDDLNLTLASGAADSAAANGAGITIDGASATMLYTHSTTSFDFNKPVNVTGDVRIKGDAGTLNFYRTTSPADIASIEYNHSDSVLKFWSKNKGINFSSADADQDTPHLYIKGTTGEVGIGTSAPNAQLEISNDGTSGNIPTLRLNSTEGNVGNGDVIGQIDWKSADGGRTGDPIASIKAVSSIADGSHTDLTFSTGEDSSSASERMRIASDGKVGIGETSLNAQLTIKGDATTVGQGSVYFNRTGQTGMSIGLKPSSDDLVIGTSWNPASGTAVTIESTGSVKIEDGDLVIGTAGHGVLFSGFADANKLTDYEEGTWAANFNGPGQGTTSVIVASTAVGRYTKIGNLVTVHGQFQQGTHAATSGVALQVAGLPFQSASNQTNGESISTGAVRFYNQDTAGTPIGVVAHQPAGTSHIEFYSNNDNGAPTTIDRDDSAYVAFTITYTSV